MKAIKVIPICVVFLTLIVGSSFVQNNSDQILGKWFSEDNTKTVEVFKENGKFSAKIIDAKDKVQVGKIIVWDLQYDNNEKEWSGGEVQLPEMSHPASCYVKLKGEKIIITGYHGFRIFGSSQTYSRKK